MNSITIDCDECIMRATTACTDCVVTFICDRSELSNDDHAESALVFSLAEQRAVRWFAEAGMVPTLRHRAAANA